jgi:hypothetical protein
MKKFCLVFYGSLAETILHVKEHSFIQWGSKFRTSPEFEWSIQPRTGHLKTEPFEIRTNSSGFQMVTSLDRFMKKSVITNILFMTKRSRLAKENKFFRSGFQMALATGRFCLVFEW